MATWVRVNPIGLTPVPGVWTAANVGDSTALVIGATGNGSRAAVAINADLVAHEIATAVAADRHGAAPEAPA